MHWGKVDPGVSELSRDHVNRPQENYQQLKSESNHFSLCHKEPWLPAWHDLFQDEQIFHERIIQYWVTQKVLLFGQG